MIIRISVFLILLFGATACAQQEEHIPQGGTMDTGGSSGSY